jgi:acyl carrier protein
MNDIKSQVKKLIVERLNLRMEASAIQDDVALFDSTGGGLGLDSIDALDLAVGLFEEFEVEVGQNDMPIFANVNSIAAHVEGRLAEQRSLLQHPVVAAD